MAKRVFGWVLFLWMGACLVGLIGETRDKVGTRFWMNIAIGVFLVACAGTGLMMGLGKDKPSEEADGEDQVADSES